MQYTFETKFIDTNKTRAFYIRYTSAAKFYDFHSKPADGTL